MVSLGAAILMLALAEAASGSAPAAQPVRIVENQRIPCLVHRGAYCIPDQGFYVTVYSSDESPSIILKVGDRIAGSGYGFAIESGRCDGRSARPALLGRLEGQQFEGETWQAADFRLNASCRLRILSKPWQRGGNEFASRMLSIIRPCGNRACQDGSLVRLLPEFAPRRRQRRR